MQLTPIQKQELARKIAQSNSFKNAPTSTALLLYLHDATSKGVNLKEGVIDMEFFGGKESLDKNNPRVRVNVYNLRKKLKHYYIDEGKNDGWKLHIDKGQYEIRFIKTDQSSLFLKKITWKNSAPYLALLIAISALIITNLPPKKPTLWNSFLSDNKPTNLFIGDHFGISGNTVTGHTGWTRDFEINNINEFYSFIDKNPDLKNALHPSSYSYTTNMGPIASQQFQKFYQNYHKNLSVLFSTQSSISEIKEGNAIYAGPTKNNNLFIYFFNQANPYVQISDNTLFIKNHPTIKDRIIELKSPEVDQEYAIVSKYPSAGDTQHFVFFSQHDIGVTATVEYFTNNDSIKKFTETYLKDKDNFTAIFKVKGQNRTNTDLKLEMVLSF